jgi:ABC-type phosphate/phosphonate transport system substrate-binding protein
VTDGRADLASIDCVSFALLERGRSELIERVAVVAESPLSPGLPFIASAGLPAPTVATIREAVFAALADPNLAETRAALGLKGARPTSAAEYDRVAEIERDAAAAGYARLA